MAQRSITSFFSGAAVTVSRKISLAEVAEPGDEIDDLANSQLMNYTVSYQARDKAYNPPLNPPLKNPAYSPD